MDMYDSVIVGAGAAGAYVLLRLSLDAKQAGRVCMVEATHRTNGRVMSIREPGAPVGGVALELGAMRFMQHHVIVRSLINRFRLKTRKHSFETNFLHLRGRRVQFSDGAADLRGLSPKFDEVYLLDQDERGRSPGNLFNLAIFRACRDIKEEMDGRPRNQMSKQEEALHAWLAELIKIGPENPWPCLPPALGRVLNTTVKLRGIFLHQIGFWNLLQYYTSTEGFHLIRDGLGYYSITSEWNAADALVRFLNEIRPEQTYQTIDLGMGALLDAMYKEAVKNLNKPTIFANHQLMEVEKQGAHFKLTMLARTHDQPLSEEPDQMSPDVITREIGARRLFLCLPAGAVKRIRFTGFESFTYRNANNSELKGSTALHLLADSVASWPLQKIILVFDSPWWNTKHKQHLPSTAKIITDTAVRQIYLDGRKKNRAIVMVYIDGPPVGAWQSLQDLPDDDGFLPALYPSLPQTTSAVSLRMFDKLSRLFAIFFEVEKDGIPKPLCAGMKTWGGWPEWAGWHSWRTGCQSPALRQLIAQPVKSFGICGEAYSTTQGWIEGAFRSAEFMLSRAGLPPSPWIERKFLDKIGCASVQEYLDS